MSTTERIGRTDRIEREIVVPAPPERVWSALTEASELAQWFGDVAEIDLEPGGRARFGWTEHDAVVDAVVEIVDAPHRFGFRWPAGNGVPLGSGQDTHVEFTLVAHDGGTLLRVVETGFASLPDEVYEQSLAENSSGWDAELRDLVGHLQAAMA